jgi:hypothetical protein
LCVISNAIAYKKILRILAYTQTYIHITHSQPWNCTPKSNTNRITYFLKGLLHPPSLLITIGLIRKCRYKEYFTRVSLSNESTEIPVAWNDYFSPYWQSTARREKRIQATYQAMRHTLQKFWHLHWLLVWPIWPVWPWNTTPDTFFFSRTCADEIVIVLKSRAHGRNQDYFRENLSPTEALEGNLQGEMATVQVSNERPIAGNYQYLHIIILIK